MKKFYSLFIGFITLGIVNIYSQDVIVDGNMENASSWKVSALNNDTANDVTYTFNYTTVIPASGSGGCLYISGTNGGATGSNLTSIMFYQQVTLHRGTTYNFDGAYKDNRTNNYWCEVYVGGNEPTAGTDYGTDQGAIFVSGFKSTNWETNCPSDVFDGTFANDACTIGTTNTVLFEGTGDTTVYIGFRPGIWDDGSNGYTFETYIDNISLAPAGSNAIDMANENIFVSPNPVSDVLNLNSVNEIVGLQIVNMLGQTVYTDKKTGTRNIAVDFSEFPEGMYLVISLDSMSKTSMVKILKQN